MARTCPPRVPEETIPLIREDSVGAWLWWFG
jgi:hypothetical protein